MMKTKEIKSDTLRNDATTEFQYTTKLSPLGKDGHQFLLGKGSKSMLLSQLLKTL